MEKVRGNSIDKKQNGLKYSKNRTNHPPSPINTENKTQQQQWFLTGALLHHCVAISPIVWRFQGRIQMAGIAMPDLQNLLSPNLCQNSTVYTVRYASSSVSFVCKRCTEKSAVPPQSYRHRKHSRQK